ncbi:rRNA maturation RNase YbeY [Cognatiyoonia sp. IB215446]|uniref:rRNA maturation RNase YbeY n=1 Tax=Cognatiyoonia sp. IB215446 TaxID=3097355 RepID=UPI002A0C0991|nr:rRNA maturation RNase YbeY [Cognatiyoonia sp. IB215446]MDX8347955.1 rRNA maturation RNase YbeY [Cognatiyoonia sp. IB215446]
MSVDIVIEDPRWADIAALAERATDAALERLGLEPSAFEISLLACDDARIAVLNEDFRGKATATNVLSWPSAERAAAMDGEMPLPPSPGVDAELGDIAIAFETCHREATEAGKPFADHTLHLLVHGTLHLLGFDHVRDRDATLMEGLETEILGKLGLSDPYRM